MWTTEDQTVAAGHSVDVDPARWQELLEELLGRVAGRFARVDLRRRARAFVWGLLSDLPRKNCWTIAEHAGDPSPDGMQHLLGRAVWDQDKLRDDVRDYVRDYVTEHLGDRGAVLVVDETGDLKEGHHHRWGQAPVHRHRRAGRERPGRGLPGLCHRRWAWGDRPGVVPAPLWTDDPQRMQAAGVPDQVGFATKPALATAMICRALDAGVPAGWVAGDEVYGANPKLRAELEARQIGYVLVVACDHPVRFGGDTHHANALLRHLPARAWQQISCGKGAKGHRYYDWAFLRLDHHHHHHHGPAPGGQAGQHWLMVRRNQRTGELAFYHCFTPRPTPLAVLVRVAGCRWRIEEAFQAGKGLCGLDQHQVRRWRSWYRWATLSMLAHAFLMVAALAERTHHPAPSELVPLSCNEIQHLFAALLAQPAGDRGHRLRWSLWRRRHQARARTCHYQRQAAWQP